MNTGNNTTAPMLAGEFLAESARLQPDKLAIVAGPDGAFRQTYAELDRQANRIANAIRAAGIGKGRRVAILSSNQQDYPAVYFGAARSGAIIANLSTRATPGELAHMLKRTEVELLFVQSDLLEIATGVRQQLPMLETIVVLNGPGEDGAPALAEFLEGQPDTPPDIAIAPEDPYCITFTGGTTGFPKAVLVNHAARAHSCHVTAETFEMLPTDVMACTTPLFHVAGLYVWFQTGILLGCTMVLIEKWDTGAFFDAIGKLGVTSAFLVPTQITALMNDPGFSQERTKTLRYINFGGAPTSPALLARMQEAFPHAVLVEQYGQSEAGPISVRPSSYNDTKPGSVGRSMPRQELAVLDEKGRPQPPGVPGEVALRGPSLFLGYDKDPELTREVMDRRGWLRTGDVGAIDEDGFLTLIDRSKDMIISGGENIYPTEIENALYRHPQVKECAVFGIPDELWGEVPAAHIVLRDGAAVTEEDLAGYCATMISRHKRPRLIRFVDALPKTAVGKIQKNVIREEYWAARDKAI